MSGDDLRASAREVLYEPLSCEAAVCTTTAPAFHLSLFCLTLERHVGMKRAAETESRTEREKIGCSFFLLLLL